MSIELIDRIVVRKDGVYLSSRKSNDTASSRLRKDKILSNIYDIYGQKGLDHEILCMLYEHSEYVKLWGNHKSLERYRYAKDTPEAHAIYKRYTDQISDRFESMDKADQDSVWHEPTKKAKEYRTFEGEMLEKMYQEIAARCEEYDKQHKA